MHPSNDTPLKKCSKCGNEYPATTEYFPINRSKLGTACRECARQCTRAWRLADPEREKVSRKKYFAKHIDQVHESQKIYREAHKEEARQRSQDWREHYPNKAKESDRRNYAEHLEARRKRASEYRELNREAQREKSRRYYAEHPEIFRLAARRRRAKKCGNGGSHSIQDIRLQIKAQTDKKGRLHCWWCGEVIGNAKYHIDHIVSLHKGGNDSPDNLCISCPKCNLSKGTKSPQEFSGRLL